MTALESTESSVDSRRPTTQEIQPALERRPSRLRTLALGTTAAIGAGLVMVGGLFLKDTMQSPEGRETVALVSYLNSDGETQCEVGKILDFQGALRSRAEDGGIDPAQMAAILSGSGVENPSTGQPYTVNEVDDLLTTDLGGLPGGTCIEGGEAPAAPVTVAKEAGIGAGTLVTGGILSFLGIKSLITGRRRRKDH
jgi:hypothetical protein